jgi:hypothetical protein
MGAPYQGGCQCGEVRYIVKAEPATLYVCHCRDCQKQSASAFAMSLTVATDQFRVTAGVMKEWRRPAASGADVFCRFCPTCGTRIVHGKDTRPAFINIKAGTLDDTSWLQPVAQIWTSRAQPWVDMGDRYLSYSEQPADTSAMWSRWQEEHALRISRDGSLR